MEALERPHGHVGGDGRPQGEGVDEHGGEVGHGEGLEALQSSRCYVSKSKAKNFRFFIVMARDLDLLIGVCVL